MSNVVPEEWSTYQVGELSKVKRGASPRPIQDPKWWGGSVGWVRISDVTSSYKYLTKTTQYLSAEGVSKSVQITPGEVILSICATIGRPIIVGVDACIHDGFVWFDKLNNSIDREYWYYFLSSKEEFLSGQRQSGTQGNLNTSIVAQLECPLPLFPEQKKIAAILSSVDEVIEKTRAQIDKLQDLKTGMMQELLTKGIGHTEFKDSPVGRIPAGWDVKPLGELSVKISDGIHTTPKYTEKSDYRFVNGNNLKNGHIYVGASAKYVPESEYLKHRKDLSPNTILMSINGTIGNLAYYRGEKVVLGKSAAFISLKDDQSKEFVYFVLQSQSVKTFYDFELTGSTISNLSLRSVKDTPIPNPPKSEQKKIAGILTDIERQLECRKQKVARMNSLKKALMQDLLTGKVRVQVDTRELADA